MDSSCISDCEVGFYYDHDQASCQSCSLYCVECATSATTCQSCVTEGTYEAYLFDNSCMENCPTGYYGDVAVHICYACDILCSACQSSSSNCSSCQTEGTNQAFLLNNSCLLKCPEGHFGNQSVHECNQCDPKCVACEESANNCSVCQSSGENESFLHNNICESSCPENYFANYDSH